MLQQADLCAGWKAGGTIMQGFAEGFPRWSPAPTPRRSTSDDPWRGTSLPGALPAHAMRRRRRIDLVPGTDGGPLVVDAHVPRQPRRRRGNETVVHKYTVHAHVEPQDFRVIAAQATPQVLPWFECPEAAASADRLAG